MEKMKKYSVIAILLIATMILAACGTPAAAPTAAPTQAAPAGTTAATTAPTYPAGTTVLKIYLLDYTADTITWLQNTIDPAFEAAHPGVKVEITQGSWTGWDTTFAGFFAAGDGPDIINLGSEMNTLYGKSLANMDQYLGKDAWADIANFGPALANATFDGHLRGLPIFTAPRYVFCRTDLMTAGGWTTGTPKTFADWVKFGKQLSKIDSTTNSLSQQALVPADANSMADWQWWLLVYYSLGGKLYKADGTPNFDSPEALATTKFVLDMRQATYGPASAAVGGLPTTQGSVIDVDDATQKDNGAVCLAHSGWAAPAYTRPIWSKISIDPFYGDSTNFPNSKPVVLAFNDWLAVPEYSKNKELAADWLKMAFTKEANNKWNETMGLIPARNDSQYGFVTESPQLKAEAELASKYGVGFANIDDSAQLQTIMQDALGKLVTEELTPEEVNAKIQSDYTAALSNK
jgi:ABC-type glycerol-3-phosphate transport system substrate-binding protein